MATSPKVIAQNYQERIGIHNVGLKVTESGHIFREFNNTDIGIDGQVEFINGVGEVVGKIAAAQVKSGDSCLVDHGNFWRFYPDKKHYRYWEAYPIPVILFVFRPSDNNVYAIDVRQHIRIKGDCPIDIPKENIVSKENPNLLNDIGKCGEQLYQSIDLLNRMIENTIGDSGISYLDLFLGGLTNLTNQLFFDISLACNIQKVRTRCFSFGCPEYDALKNYITFIVTQNLADIDYLGCMTDWEKGLVPRFITYITPRGRAFLEYITCMEKEHSDLMPNIILVQESLIYLKLDQSAVARIQKIKAFQDQIMQK